MNERDRRPDDPPQEWGPRSHEPPGPPRSGTEPLTARTDLPLRMLLSVIFAPLFTLLTAGFVAWWLSTGRGESPRPDELRLLVLALGAVTVISWIDLFVVRRRIRRQRQARGG